MKLEGSGNYCMFLLHEREGLVHMACTVGGNISMKGESASLRVQSGRLLNPVNGAQDSVENPVWF